VKELKSVSKLIFLFQKTHSGAAAVEFVLIAPLFLAIMIGGVDLGRYLFFQHELNSAVQEAGRFAMVRGSSAATPATPNAVINFAVQQLQFNNPNNVTFTVTFAPNNSRGSTVRVRGQASFQIIGGLRSSSALTLNAISINIMVN